MRCELQLTWVRAQKEDGAPQGWDRWEEFSWSFNQVPEAECGLMQECKPTGVMDTGDTPLPRPLLHIPSLGSREEDWGEGREPDRTPCGVGWRRAQRPTWSLAHYRQELQFSAGGGEAEQTLPLPLGDKSPWAGGGKRKTLYPWVRGREPPWVWTIRDCLLPREKGSLPRPGEAVPTQDWVCTRTTGKALDSPLGLAGTTQQAWQSVMGRRRCVKETHAEAWVNMRGVTEKREGTEKKSLATNL